MRDRQANGNIGQIEVLEATCSSTQVPAAAPAVVVNNIAPDPVGINPPPYFPPAQPNMQQQPSSSK
jgi:hypothetical protein